MCLGDIGYGWHGTIRLDAGPVHKKRTWIYCDVLADQPPDLSSKYLSILSLCLI